MITWCDANNMTTHFKECANKALSLLRYSDIVQIIKIESDCKTLIAKNAAMLSKLTLDIKIFSDIYSKMINEDYIPVLKKCLEVRGSQLQNINKAANVMSNHVKERIGYEEERVDIVANEESFIEPNIAYADFRDAKYLVEIVNSMISAEGEVSKADEKNLNNLEAMYRIISEKSRNKVANFKNDIKNIEDKIDELKTIIDSCTLAKYIRQCYNLLDSDSTVSFLDENIAVLLPKAATAAKQFIKEA